MPVPNDWRSFTAAMPTFTTLFHKAFQTIPKLVLDTTPPEGDTAGLVIIQLMAASMPDLDDILTLSSHDGHWGALKLLRSLFERNGNATDRRAGARIDVILHEFRVIHFVDVIAGEN